MSLNVSLFNALTGLQTNQSALQVTSNNVTNANTPGYTRKSAQQESIVIGGSGAGVKLSNVTRLVDDFLVKQLRSASSEVGNYKAQNDFLQYVQDLFGSLNSQSSIGASISNFAAKSESLAATPESASARASVVSAADAVARQLNSMSREIQQLRSQADQEISKSVDIVNQQLGEIDRLNGEIARNKVQGQPTGDLEDKRDLAVNKLTEQIDVNYFTRSTGELVIFTRNGRTLLSGDPLMVSHAPVAATSAATVYPGGIDGIMVGSYDITNEIGSGRLAALVQMRDSNLPALTAEISTLAATLRDEMNRIHNDGSGFPAATTLTGSRAQTGTAVSLTGTVEITLLNADGTQAYTATVAAPGTLDAAGFATEINTALAGFGGSLATESGGVVSINGGGTYGVVISGGVVDPGGGQQTTSVSDFLHLNDFFVGDDPTGTDYAATLAVRGDILSDPARMSRGVLRLDAVSGEYYVSPGDNEIAQRLAARFQDQISFGQAGELTSISTTFAGYGAEILSVATARYNRAQDSLDFQTTVAQDLDYRASSMSGVNVDEEMSNLVLYQNAYAASARLVTVVSDMYDVLLQMG